MITLGSRMWQCPLTASRCKSFNRSLIDRDGEAGNERNRHPFSNTIGAEIQGADFSGSVSLDDLTVIKQALIDNLVLVIRDQKLDPGELLSAVHVFTKSAPWFCRHDVLGASA
jgi:alpha-ketoglutarate-dependent taurine dioxygenase